MGGCVGIPKKLGAFMPDYKPVQESSQTEISSLFFSFPSILKQYKLSLTLLIIISYLLSLHALSNWVAIVTLVPNKSGP